MGAIGMSFSKFVSVLLLFVCATANATYTPQPQFSIGSVNYFGPRCTHTAGSATCSNDAAGVIVTLYCRTTAGAGTCSGRLNDATAGWTSAFKLRITSVVPLRGAAGELNLGYSDNDGGMAGSVTYTNYKNCMGEVNPGVGFDTTSSRTFNIDCVVPAGKFVSGNQALAGTWQITGTLE
jgi:hypothetical protein